MTLYPCPKPIPDVPEPKLRRPTERSKANMRARAEWAAKVKARAGDRCQLFGQFDERTLGCSGPIDAAHVIGRGRRPRLVLDLENGIALCRRHHDLLDRTRWFKPHFRAWFDVVFPGRMERLARKAREGRIV